jgi:hypothetical protein
MQVQPTTARDPSIRATHDYLPKLASLSPSDLRPTKAREIYSYIALRDILLTKAEEQATAESICRARIANEVVETCLGEVRLPYEAQYLNEADSTRERQNCLSAKKRIAALEANGAELPRA